MAVRFTLAGDVAVPALGFGTFQLRGAQVASAVAAAVEAGYKLIDTATVYRNEEDIGKCLRELRVPREEMFITSKLAPRDHGYDAAVAAIKASLQRLGVDYLDMYLIHWPGKQADLNQFLINLARRASKWLIRAIASCAGRAGGKSCVIAERDLFRALEDMQKSGVVRTIGVSNFTVAHLEDLLSVCRVVPAVNQVELHPFLLQGELRKYCQDKNIWVQAYSSLGCGKLLSNDTVAAIATRLGREVLLRWGVQHGCGVLPKSSNPARIACNADIFGFELAEADMMAMDALDRGEHFCWDPSGVA